MFKKICVVTGSRAEFGLLRPVIEQIKASGSLKLQLIATGMHLSNDFGSTYREIEAAGFEIYEKIDIGLNQNNSIGVSTSVSLGVRKFAELFEKTKPDLLLVLGDRFEIFAAAQAAMFFKIPIAHLHGGEATEGLVDEAIRHSITKMAHLHFVSCEEYRKRVIQLGEHPNTVFNFGAAAFDSLSTMQLLEKHKLEEQLGITFSSPTFLVTYHPVTLLGQSPLIAFEQLLDALAQFDGAKIIFTKANADEGGKQINTRIDEFVSNNIGRAVAHTSLGQLKYFSALKHCDLVLGNSSSGLIEAPFFKKATINIGERQRGRIKAASVIDCAEEKQAIVDAIEKALSKKFKIVLDKVECPFYKANTATNICKVLENTNLEKILMKRFYDLASEKC